MLRSHCLSALRGTPAAEPDWVAVHEEQCCLYGAIWIHAPLDADARPHRHSRLFEALGFSGEDPIPPALEVPCSSHDPALLLSLPTAALEALQEGGTP